MAPSKRDIGSFVVDVVSEKLTKLLAGLDLSDSSHWTGFNGNIVGIVDRGHKVSQKSGHRQARRVEDYEPQVYARSTQCIGHLLHAHMSLIAGRPKWERMLAQEVGSLLNGLGDVPSLALKNGRVLNLASNEWLECVSDTLLLSCFRERSSSHPIFGKVVLPS